MTIILCSTLYQSIRTSDFSSNHDVSFPPCYPSSHYSKFDERMQAFLDKVLHEENEDSCYSLDDGYSAEDSLNAIKAWNNQESLKQKLELKKIYNKQHLENLAQIIADIEKSKRAKFYKNSPAFAN